MNKFRDWEILDTLPNGWKIDKTAGSPAPKTVFVTNGKSVFNGQKRALLRVYPENCKPEGIKAKQEVIPEEKQEIIFPVKTVNDLARLKFKQRLLIDIRIDLMVCEIEGWNKKDYIKELKSLLNSINTTTKKECLQQPSLF